MPSKRWHCLSAGNGGHHSHELSLVWLLWLIVWLLVDPITQQWQQPSLGGPGPWQRPRWSSPSSSLSTENWENWMVLQIRAWTSKVSFWWDFDCLSWCTLLPPCQYGTTKHIFEAVTSMSTHTYLEIFFSLGKVAKFVAVWKVVACCYHVMGLGLPTAYSYFELFIYILQVFF